MIRKGSCCIFPAVCYLLAIVATGTSARGGEFSWIEISNQVPLGVSADGSTVYYPFATWTPETGLIEFVPDSREYLVSDYFSTDQGVGFVGGVRGNAEEPYAPFKWTEQTGFRMLGQLPPEPGQLTVDTYASDASDDGSVVTGYCHGRPCWWDSLGNATTIGPFPPDTVMFYDPSQGIPPATVSELSSDGEVAVGSYWTTSNVRSHAYKWSQEQGVVDLVLLPGHIGALPANISADGTVIVGFTQFSPDTLSAFRWTAENGMKDLGQLPGHPQGRADLVSADGSVILGNSFTRNSGRSPGEMFIWDEQHGMQNLTAYILMEFGIDLNGAGATPEYLTPDRRSLVGTFTKPSLPLRSWIVKFDQPLGTELLTVPEPHGVALALVVFIALVRSRSPFKSIT